MMPDDARPRALPLLDGSPRRDEPAEVLAWFDRDALPENRPQLVLHPPGHIVVVRVGDEVFAFDQVCVHGKASLFLGTVRDGTLRCRAHDYRFDLRTGALVHPAGEAMCQPTWPVERRGERWAVLDLRSTGQGQEATCRSGGG